MSYLARAYGVSVGLAMPIGWLGGLHCALERTHSRESRFLLENELLVATGQIAGVGAALTWPISALVAWGAYREHIDT